MDLVQIKKTVLEMMSDRGYQTKSKIVDIDNKNLEILESSNETEICYIFFSEDTKLRVQEFRKYQQIMENDDIHHCIIVCDQGATSFTSTELVNVDPSELEIELIPSEFLIRNPTKHYFYRPHRILSEEEKKLFLQKFDKDKLAMLPKNNRIPKYFNFPVGSIIEITRCMGSAGPYHYYRIVVE